MSLRSEGYTCSEKGCDAALCKANFLHVCLEFGWGEVQRGASILNLEFIIYLEIFAIIYTNIFLNLFDRLL